MNVYEISVTFEATSEEAEKLLEEVAHVVCGGEGEGDEHVCVRSWFGAHLRDVTAEGAFVAPTDHRPRAGHAIVQVAPAPSREASRAVVDALLAFGEQQALVPKKEPSFTPDRDANAFVISNPFAFLLGVVFDQQILAELAWQAPYELYRRLGHLDLKRIVGESQTVAEAIARKPALHRFVNNTADWVVAAAQRVLDQYGGDAAAIWSDNPFHVRYRSRRN